MTQQTNPKHYATANGKDLFALMEEGLLTPEHYTGFLVGNITKYINRAEHKNGAEDLAKAGAYLATLGVKLYGVDFGPLLLEAVGEQLAKHTQPTTLVDEDDLDHSTLGVIATLNDEDLKKYAHEIVELRNNIATQSLEDHTEQPTDPVLEYLTDEANVEDFNNVRDLYRKMLEAGIKDCDEAREYLTYSDNKKAKVALVRCFRNLYYSSDWDDMVKYFAPVVTAQLQAEADEETKASKANTEPELDSKLNPVELSALEKAYRDIIELDTADKRTKYLQANSSWLGVPLVRAFNNDGYREDVTDLLNWGLYNVTAGLPIPKSKRTEDPEHLALLNKVYHLIMFKYTVEDRHRAIDDTSDDEFSWGEVGKVTDITNDLLDDESTELISEDVITYFIDNPDQATYD